MKICTYSLFAQYLDALMGHPQTNGTVALLVRKYDAVTGLSLRLKMWHIWCKGKKTWCIMHAHCPSLLFILLNNNFYSNDI